MLSSLETAQTKVRPITRFDDLFERLYPSLFGLTWRVLDDRDETEDVLQEGFLKLASSSLLDQPDEEVAAWLRRVCLNLAFNRLRGRQRAQARLERIGRLAGESGETDPSPTVAVLRQEQQAHVRAILARLPERQRNCLLLRHSGHSYAEIATTLNVAIGSVGVLLARAERAFRDYYEEENDDPSDHSLP